MYEQLEADGSASAGAWLYVAEQVHRIGNEYASAIATLRLAAARTSSDEARAVVLGATRRLSAYAATQNLLKPPAVVGQVDLADHVVQLCGTIALARFEDLPIGLSVRTAQPVLLDATRCWRAGLVVSELITNAARHAFAADSRRGEIAVGVVLAHGQVTCEVSDTGAWAAKGGPGLGSALVLSLAADLGGQVIRRSNASGTSVKLMFPERSTAHLRAARTAGRRAALRLHPGVSAAGLIAREA